MTFPFDPTIPAAPNDPADDQPLMQTNFASINSWTNVDHVPFNTSPAGTHKQVTFSSNNVPAPPVSPPQLFTNTVAGLPQLFFYSGDAAHSSTQYSAATDGTTFALGGIIIKWGMVAAPTDNVAINFPVAFPNNCFSIVVTPVKTGSVSNITGFALKAPPSVSSFTIRFSGTTLDYVSYVAIGN